MSAKPSKYFDYLRFLVEEGFTEYATDLMRLTLKSLKEDDLSISQRNYLISAMTQALKTGDLDKSFGFKIEPRKKRKATGQRDLLTYSLMESKFGGNIKHAERLELVARTISKRYPEAPIDAKSVGRILTEGRKNKGQFAEYKFQSKFTSR